MPLGHFKAIEQAIELRKRGHMWTWPAISDAMEVYHGFKRSPGWWRRHLAGMVVSRERGRAVYGSERVHIAAKRSMK